MCNCIEAVNNRLEQHNAKILTAFTLSKDLSNVGSRMLVTLEKIDHAPVERPVRLSN